jgi:hypothetical protein
LPLPYDVRNPTVKDLFASFAEYIIQWLDDQVEIAKQENTYFKSFPDTSREGFNNRMSEINRVILIIKSNIPLHLETRLRDVSQKWREMYD